MPIPKKYPHVSTHDWETLIDRISQMDISTEVSNEINIVIKPSLETKPAQNAFHEFMAEKTMEHNAAEINTMWNQLTSEQQDVYYLRNIKKQREYNKDWPLVKKDGDTVYILNRDTSYYMKREGSIGKILYRKHKDLYDNALTKVLLEEQKSVKMV